MSSTATVTKKKKNVRKYTEEELKRAMLDIQVNGMPVKEACRLYGIPKSTMQGRLSGTSETRGPDPVLGVENEKQIKEWIFTRAKYGFPIKKQEFLDAVQKIVKDSGKKNPFKNDRPGKSWYTNFLKRHPELRNFTIEGNNSCSTRITEESIRNWFNELETFLKETDNKDILEHPERIFNGCECSFNISSKTGKVMAPKALKSLFQIRLSKEKNTITVLVILNANTQICPPLVVIPNVRLPQAIVESMPAEWCLGLSESGLIKSDILFKYITSDFNEWVEHNSIKKPILLLYDGDRLQISQDLSSTCEILGIILYALPPNTDLLQPAEVSIFGRLKSSWKEAVRFFLSKPENLNSSLNKNNFCQFFRDTLENQFMNLFIKDGFRKCGLYPFNPDAIDYIKCEQNNLNNKPESSTSKYQEKSQIPEVKYATGLENTMDTIDINSNDFSVNEISKKVKCETDCVNIMDTLDNTSTFIQIEYTTCGPSVTVPFLPIFNKFSEVMPSRTVDKNVVEESVLTSDFDISVAHR